MSSFVINKQEYIKAGGFFAGLADQRITPACAGKRLSLSPFMPYFWDHPRLCGKKGKLSIGIRVNMGSPPLVRGKDRFAYNKMVPSGITPACAGKSAVNIYWFPPL